MKKITFTLFFIIQVLVFSLVEIKLPLNDFSTKYPLDVLKLILEKSGAEYEIITTELEYSQNRIKEELRNGTNSINLDWIGTSAKLERELLPIRIPIYKGLLGYRVFIINKNNQDEFATIQNLSDLQNFKGIQGIGWSDIEVLENSGLHQLTNHYDKIFAMIDKNRADYFSRGIGEAFVELEERKELYNNLKVEEKVLLVYPFAMFFFTSKNNQELKEVLEDGFKKAYSDGSFDELFYSHPDIKKILKEGKIESRLRIDIPNPFLTQETLNINQQYWYKK